MCLKGLNSAGKLQWFEIWIIFEHTNMAVIEANMKISTSLYFTVIILRLFRGIRNKWRQRHSTKRKFLFRKKLSVEKVLRTHVKAKDISITRCSATVTLPYDRLLRAPIQISDINDSAVVCENISCYCYTYKCKQINELDVAYKYYSINLCVLHGLGRFNVSLWLCYEKLIFLFLSANVFNFAQPAWQWQYLYRSSYYTAANLIYSPSNDS